MIKSSITAGLLLTFGAAVNAASAPVADVNSGSLEERIAVLERMVKTRANAQHRIQGQLDTIQDEVNELRGAVEVHTNQLERILTRQRELYLEIGKVADNLANQPATPPPFKPSVTTSQQMSATGESDAYDRAVNLILKEKRYDEAIPEFQAFLQNFPNSDYAPNAHYWLGQLLFNKQDWTGSSEQFQAVMAKYPDSSKRADAILKLGMVEQKRANLAKAKQLFQQVITEYPNSSAAKLAEARVRSL